ncbi:Dabb family protein [Lutibacter citreus]|uniref:Dabb family protein n=1 Tax=Lutibacter citreus TaxID=2138210 RepID=UPI000DBE6E01|nr:Dabb family protein [Lutibacter citreus]
MDEKFIHMVFFWLKNPTDATDKLEFEKAINKFLETSVYAKNKHFGVPAKTNRPVVDSSYTYCLKVTFENIEEHDKYQIEPAHKLFIAEASKLWGKVLIFDSESV